MTPAGPPRSASSALAWAGFAVAGGGLVTCALGSERWAQAPAWSGALAVLGLAEVGWALASLAAGRALLPRSAVSVLLVTGAAWPVAIAQDVAPAAGSVVASAAGATTASAAGAASAAAAGTGTAGTTAPGMVAATATGALTSADVTLTLLHLVGAAGVVALARGRGAQPAGPEGAGRTLLGWAVPALVAAALVTPGLAATQAGALAQPHGGHGAPADPGPADPGAPALPPGATETRPPPAPPAPPVPPAGPHAGH